VVCDSVASDAVVLATAPGHVSGGNEMPVLGFKRVGAGKVLVSAVLPFWTWEFNGLDRLAEMAPCRRFLSGTLQWLTVSDDFAPLRVKPTGEVFTQGEPVTFEGWAYDLGYRPIPSASGTVTLVSDETNEKYQTDLISDGQGRLFGEFGNLPPGGYRYQGELVKDGQRLKQDEGVIQVESFSLEEFDRFERPMLLADIARLSHGRYFEATDFDQVLAAMNLTPRTTMVSRRIIAWGSIWILVTAVIALCLEWTIRKTYQLL
jgi:hypothetical protein